LKEKQLNRTRKQAQSIKGSTMLVTIEQLQQISFFSGLDIDQLAQLQTHAVVKQYSRGEIILHEGDRLPSQLFAVFNGRIEIKNPAASRRGMEADLLPNLMIRIASQSFRRRAAGNLTRTGLKSRKPLLQAKKRFCDRFLPENSSLLLPSLAMAHLLQQLLLSKIVRFSRSNGLLY
jgi:hypothetical protein